MLLSFDFGEYHPFKTYRLGLAYGLIEAYRLIDRDGVMVCQPRKATEQEALTFHNAGYLEALRLSDSGLWVPRAPPTIRYSLESTTGACL